MICVDVSHFDDDVSFYCFYSWMILLDLFIEIGFVVIVFVGVFGDYNQYGFVFLGPLLLWVIYFFLDIGVDVVEVME